MYHCSNSYIQVSPSLLFLSSACSGIHLIYTEWLKYVAKEYLCFWSVLYPKLLTQCYQFNLSLKNIQIFWLLHNQITEQHFMSYGVWRNLYSLNYQLNFILLSNSTFCLFRHGLTKPLLPTYNTHFLSSIPFLKCFFFLPTSSFSHYCML